MGNWGEKSHFFPGGNPIHIYIYMFIYMTLWAGCALFPGTLKFFEGNMEPLKIMGMISIRALICVRR